MNIETYNNKWQDIILGLDKFPAIIGVNGYDDRGNRLSFDTYALIVMKDNYTNSVSGNWHIQYSSSMDSHFISHLCIGYSLKDFERSFRYILGRIKEGDTSILRKSDKRITKIKLSHEDINMTRQQFGSFIERMLNETKKD